MDDCEIVALYLCRSEEAIKETSEKYGVLGEKLAQNILGNEEDARECVNDALLALWDQIPPEEPEYLRAYFCRIVRNQAMSRYRKESADKRGAGKVLPMDGLLFDIKAADDVARQVENAELTREIERFLNTLSVDKRVMFVKRFWFCESVKDIAQEFGMGQRQASTKISRIKKALIKYLHHEGWIV